MVIERQDQNIIIKTDTGINMTAVQKLIDYVNVLEINAQNKGAEQQAEELANEVNSNWWRDNKNKFLP